MWSLWAKRLRWKVWTECAWESVSASRDAQPEALGSGMAWWQLLGSSSMAGSLCVYEAPSTDSERVVFTGEQRGESQTVQGCWVSGQGPGCSLVRWPAATRSPPGVCTWRRPRWRLWGLLRKHRNLNRWVQASGYYHVVYLKKTFLCVSPHSDFPVLWIRVSVIILILQVNMLSPKGLTPESKAEIHKLRPKVQL